MIGLLLNSVGVVLPNSVGVVLRCQLVLQIINMIIIQYLSNINNYKMITPVCVYILGSVRSLIPRLYFPSMGLGL